MPTFTLKISDKKLNKPLYEMEVKFNDKEWNNTPEGIRFQALMDFESDFIEEYFSFNWEEVKSGTNRKTNRDSKGRFTKSNK